MDEYYTRVKVLIGAIIFAISSFIVAAVPSLVIINQSYAFIDENSTFVSVSPTSNKLSNIMITSNSNIVYSIPSTFVKVDKFNTNYTVYGSAHSFNSSKNLITSTIVDDYDKNPNIGYVVNSSQAINITSQPGLLNPFVSKDLINQKITDEIEDAIAAISAINHAGKYAEIKCTFGMVLANYKCS